MEKINIINKNPSVETYRNLRKIAGLSPKTAEAAEKGLRGTIFAVQIELEGEIVGMGRLIGDGGCHFQVVDIAVLPRHQGRGIGTLIMEEITRYIRENLPRSAYVSLIADGPAHKLYEKFGFKPTAPASVGMALHV